MLSRSYLYHLSVVPAASISIAPHAKGMYKHFYAYIILGNGVCVFFKDVFSMTKLHRDIAMHLLECVNDEEFTDQAIIKVRHYSGRFKIITFVHIGIISKD